MLTDRAPFEYRYLSRRLLTDLSQHEEAARPRWRGSLDLLPKWARIHLERSGPDFGNYQDLAMRSASLVSDQTGTLEDPYCYVAGRLPLRRGVFAPLMGWPSGKVACYRGEKATVGGPVALALFGSASNVVGRRPEAETSEYYPSDIAGLYSLLDAAREETDSPIDIDRVWDDGQLDHPTRARIAVDFACAGAHEPPEVLDFLARVFIQVDECDLGDGVTGRAIVGTPIWVATPRPDPFPGGKFLDLA